MEAQPQKRKIWPESVIIKISPKYVFIFIIYQAEGEDDDFGSPAPQLTQMQMKSQTA
jgi:hypothetical protein